MQTPQGTKAKVKLENRVVIMKTRSDKNLNRQKLVLEFEFQCPGCTNMVEMYKIL